MSAAFFQPVIADLLSLVSPQFGDVLTRELIMKARKVSGTSPARSKMVEVMTLKGLTPGTQQQYQNTLGALAVHFDCGPQTLSGEQVRPWVLDRIEQGLAPRTTNVDISTLRLFCCDAMGRPEKVAGLQFRRVPDRLPRSIPEADVATLIHGITGLRYRTATLIAYGAGLRISQVVALQVSDIKGADGLLRIGAGKGGHERMTYLPVAVIESQPQQHPGSRQVRAEKCGLEI